MGEWSMKKKTESGDLRHFRYFYVDARASYYVIVPNHLCPLSLTLTSLWMGDRRTLPKRLIISLQNKQTTVYFSLTEMIFSISSSSTTGALR
jgi:hypothetical protein